MEFWELSGSTRDQGEQERWIIFPAFSILADSEEGKPVFMVQTAVLAKTGGQGCWLYDGGRRGGFEQTFTSYVNQEMMIAKENSSEDRQGAWKVSW